MKAASESVPIRGIVKHHGFFRKQISLFEAVAMIVTGTIGAGMLGMPYAVAQSGLGIGILYILGVGLLMMGLNILIGEVAIRAGAPLQLAGLAKKYLGRWGELSVGGLMYTLLFGVLTVYIIGEGEGLSALFGRTPFFWSTVFFLVASVFIFLGVETIKKAELFLTLGLFLVVILVSAWSIRHVSFGNAEYVNLARVLYPYGIILFAFHGTTAIPTAYALVRNKTRDFRRAILISGGIVMAVYLLFTVVAVGVTGAGTTEIATIGLGRAAGPVASVLGSIFAVLAMGTCFLSAGLSLTNSLAWDFKIPRPLGAAIVVGVPYFLFAIGMRSFISAIEVVGGVLMSAEMILLVVIYLFARRHAGDIAGYSMRHSWAAVSALLLAFSAGAVYSVFNIF